jgi:hypothetical protein
MAGKRAGTFLALMERVETFTLQRAWTELGDDEFFWEPVAGAWGIRRREECTTPTPFGDGDWVADFGHDVALAADAGEDIEPLTTIGWLLWHIGSTPGRLAQVDLFGGSETIASGWTSPYLTYHPVFASASEATETLRTGWNRLRAALKSADDETLEQKTPCYTYTLEPPRAGLAVLGAPGPELPGYFFVAATLNEISHHGTQVCVLRDLYRSAR